jgi:flagellar biosynthesis/type III secretory pathway M-ring protein FliF/YscJ
MKRTLRRLRHEFTKNDGKPREQWEEAQDLKEVLLAACLIVVVALQAFFTIWTAAGYLLR